VLDNTPHELVNLKSLKQGRFVAYWAFPQALFTVELEIGLQIEALYMAAVVASCRKTNPLESQRTPKAHLLICLFEVVIPQRTASSSVGTGGRKGVEVALDLGDAMLQRQQPLPQKPLKHRPHTRPVNELEDEEVGAAASRDRDLDCVPTRLAHIFQVEGLVTSLALCGTLDDQWRRIHTHLDTTRPVGVHAAVLVVEALQLELKVRPEHQGLVHLGLEVKDMVGDCKVVFQPEGGKEDAVSHWERQPQFLFG